MGKHFSLDVVNISISQSNKEDFLFLDLHAISDGVNRNESFFLTESLTSSIPTFYNKPILAYYNTIKKDVEEHNSRLSLDKNGNIFYDYQYSTAEKPCGIIPESAIVSTEVIDDKTWIVVKNAIIWTEYNRQLIDLIGKLKEKKISVEVEVLKSYVENDIEYIQEFKLLGITILGEDIESGIENAKLIISGINLDIKKYKARFNAAYNGNSIIDKYSKNQSKDIQIDKSQNAVSNDNWGDISKSSIQDRVINASNSDVIVDDVYLLVLDGWRDAPSEKLKYPVMQYKDGKFVYNSNALLSAQIYGEAHDKEVASKAEKIRDKLGLINKEKREDMNKYIESAKQHGYACIGHFGGIFRFVKETDENKEEMSVYEVSDDKEEFKESELEDKLLHSCDDVQKMEKEHVEKFADVEAKIAELEKEKSELEKKSDELELKADELEIKIDELEKKRAEEKEQYAIACEELEVIKMANFEKETDEDMDEEEDLDEDDREELKKMRNDKKFSNREDFRREMSYMICNRKRATKKTEREKLDFSINKTKSNDKSKKDSPIKAIENI